MATGVKNLQSFSALFLFNLELPKVRFGAVMAVQSQVKAHKLKHRSHSQYLMQVSKLASFQQFGFMPLILYQSKITLTILFGQTYRTSPELWKESLRCIACHKSYNKNTV